MQTSIEVFSCSHEDADIALQNVQDSVNKYLSGFDADQIVQVIPQVTETTDSEGVTWTRYTVIVVLKTEVL
jgi:hypothetical protein